MRSRARVVGRIALMVVAVAAFGAVVMVLWNAVAPALFTGARSIDYPHALGLLVLSRLLLGGFPGRGGRHGGHYGRRWGAMTPEERSQMLHGGPRAAAAEGRQ
jgi:hypothetical protein